MIHRLDKEDYWKIRALLQPHQINDRTFNAVIDGNNRATIYTDDTDNPRSALIDVNGTISMFVGDAENEAFLRPLRKFIDNQLKKDTYESCGGTYFLCVMDDEKWERAVEETISHREYEPDYEYYYHFDPERFASLRNGFKPLPEGYSIQKIDSELIGRDEDQILSQVIEEFWYSVDDFLNIGFGYCVVKGTEVISACLSCCVHGNHHEISIETYEDEEMNKGLATAACVAYLDHCIDNGLIPYWSTLETNKESVYLGQKMGFVYESKSKTLEFEW